MQYVALETLSTMRSNIGRGECIYTPSSDSISTSTYVSKMECHQALVKGVAKCITTPIKEYNERINYASAFNNWIMASGYISTTDKTRDNLASPDPRRRHERIRTVQWLSDEGYLTVRGIGYGVTRKEANNYACYAIFKRVFHETPEKYNCTTESNQDNYTLPRVQVDVLEMAGFGKTDEQGQSTQDSDKQVNTIITRDQDESASIPFCGLDTMERVVSSETPHQFPTVTERWMPLGSITWSTDKNRPDKVAAYTLPDGLYKDQCAPNLNPFETFIYGKMDIELRLVINGNKFCVGKLVMTAKYDPYQCDALHTSVTSALLRPHVIVDAGSNNEGLLSVPFRYHRPLLRLMATQSQSGGVRTGKYATVFVQVLSPLKTGKGGTTEIQGRVYFRFKSSKFTGMSYRVPVAQGFGLEQIVTQPTCMALKEVLSGAERAFDQLGKSRNQDKPSDIRAIKIVPHSTINFATGKGITDVLPLRINPHTLTNYKEIQSPNDEPKSFYDLARRWAPRATSVWKNTDSEGVPIIDLCIDPCRRNYTATVLGELSGLEYACSQFAFWTGTIEIRLDFVSNSFHTGSLQLSAEFGRTSTSAESCQSSATYTKMFHLGEQKSVTFTVPYIYDTVMRRTTGCFYNPHLSRVSSDSIRYNALSVAPQSNTHFKARILNALRPPDSAPAEIEIIIFWRAGKNFRLHGLKGVSAMVYPIVDMDEFPLHNYNSAARPMFRRDTSGTVEKTTEEPKKQPKDATKWNDIDPMKIDDKYLENAAPPQPSAAGASGTTSTRVQGDTGEKENTDPTADFSPGGSTAHLITNDNHMNFKDLLRKPTLIIWNAAVTAQKSGGFFIPVMPPCQNMCITKSNTPNSIWVPSLQQTTSVSIMNMFRCWRGSSRYTVVVTSGTKPLYVSYIPHSGTRMLGNRNVNDDLTFDYPLCGSNFLTEIITPSINPVCTIEAPYDTENTWSLVNEEDSQRNYTWRDKGDLAAGHICIVSHEAITVDVWWSAGDDFDIANYFGSMASKDNENDYRWSDDRARVQMDFLDSEVVTNVTNFSKKFLAPRVVGRALVGSIPFVGTPMVVSEVVSTLEKDVTQVLADASGTLSHANIAINNVNNLTTNLNSIVQEAVGKISSMMGSLMFGAELLYDVLLDLLTAWMEKSWRVVGIGMVRFITKVMVVPTRMISIVMSFASKFSDFMTRVFSIETPRVEADNDNGVVLVGILVGLIGTITGVVLEPSRWNNSFSREMFTRLTRSTGMAYMVHAMNFVKTTFTVIKNMILWCLGYISPEAEALKMLSENNKHVEKFIREAQIITSESNTGLLGLPNYRRRFWYTVLQAHQIQRLMCRIPTNCVSFQLSKLCNDVIKMSNERFLDLSASPVRFEPMVICIEGPAGVGKSHMTETLVDKLLESIEYTSQTSEKVFYRTAGERFWSGYRDQPVVIYDEWLNTTDPVRCIDQLAEMMKLKSTSLFIPEMAHLEEKKVRGNPLLIIICCNNAFPNSLSDYATCKDAIWRRREMVLHVERTDAYKGVDLKKVTGDRLSEVENYKHLAFTKYTNVSDHTSRNSTGRTFDQMSTWVSQQWVNYYKAEVKQVEKRMRRLPQYIEAIEGGVKLQDPFTLFYRLGDQVAADTDTSINGYTHYEALEVAMQMVVQALDGGHTTHELDDQPDVPWEEVVSSESDPEVQGMFEKVLGVFLYGAIPCAIAKASFAQLERWEEQANPIRVQVGECCVCLGESPRCAYVCKGSLPSENKHIVCVECYASNREFGSGVCPMCRDPVMLPLLGRQDVSTMGLWSRLVQVGLRSMKWLSKKVIDYFTWRQQRPCLALLTENLFIMAYLFGDIMVTRNSCEAMGRYTDLVNSITMNRYVSLGYQAWREITDGSVVRVVRSYFQSDEIFYDVEEPVVQTDDWVDLDFAVSEPVRVQLEDDTLSATVDNDYFVTLFTERVTKGPCMHRKINEHISALTLFDDYWRLVDGTTRTIVEIPIHLCESNCYFDTLPEAQREYRIIFDRYAIKSKTALRTAIIRYYNEPTEELRNHIPRIYQADWMRPIPPTVTISWWEYLTEKWTNYRQTIIYCSAAVAALGAIYGLYNMTLGATGVLCAASQISPTADSGEQSARNPRRTISRRGHTRSVHFQTEDRANPSIYEVVVQYIVQNTFQLEIIIGTKKRTMYGTGLFNHYLLIPRHYAREIREKVGAQGHKLFGHPIMSPQLRSEMVLDFTTMIESDSTDLAYMQVPPKYPLFKDIRKFLALDSDLDTPITSEGVLLLNPKGSGSHLMREHDVDILGFTNNLPVLDQEDNKFLVKEAIQYNYSQPGICGSILLRENHTRPILSIHFAGDPGPNGTGYGVPLTQESLQHLCDNKAVPVQFEDYRYESVDKANFIFEKDVFLTYYGSLPKEKVPYLPKTTKLVPSALFGVEGLETVMEPAILSRDDPRYIHQETPLFAGVRKHGIITRDFPTNIVQQVTEQYWDMYLSRMKPLVADCRELTLDQCVVGLSQPHYVPMDLKTSAGYPFNTNKQRTLKQHYIVVERDDALQPVAVAAWDSDLMRTILRKRALRIEGIVPHTLFCDTLKDEKRKRDKLMKLGGTRVFCSSPVDYVIECRRYFMHFVAAYMHNRHQLLHAVGINPTGEEWTQIVRCLAKHNVNVGTIDYSNFGPGYNSAVAKAAYGLIIRWTMEHVKTLEGGTLNERELWCIVYECLQSMHVCNNTIYQQGAGSPSGAFFTTIINTMVNILYIMIAWNMLVHENSSAEVLPGIEFYKNVSLYCYGDDGIFSVSEKYADIFNMKTITTLFSQYNIVATDAAKTGVICEWEPLSKAQFLKRGFVVHPTLYDRWMAPLVNESIVSCTQWVWKSENMKEATYINANAALMEKYHHGPEAFNDFKTLLNRALRSKNIKPCPGTWKEYEDLFKGEGFEKKIDSLILSHIY